MKSILAIMAHVHQISRRPNNGRIPRLLGMNRGVISIVWKVLPIRIRSKLNKLLSPIQESGSNCHVQSVFPIQRTLHKCSKAYNHISQRKEMPPHKFDNFLYTFYVRLINVHYSSSILYLKNITKFFKNITINAPKGTHLLLRVTFINQLNLIQEKKL